MILKGFKFGMMLQLAIGPVCIFIFHAAASGGFINGEKGVFGAFIIDGLFIMAAAAGIGNIIKRKRFETFFKLLGMMILCFFGIDMILNQLNITIKPQLLFLNTNYDSNVVFKQALILTASNPFTIIFWSGIFAAKIAEEKMNGQQLFLFGVGAILSTLFFLSCVSAAGTIFKCFLSDAIVSILNIAVGFLLIYFSLKMFFKKI